MNVLANADALARVYAAAYASDPAQPSNLLSRRLTGEHAVRSFVELVDTLADEERQHVGATS